MTKRNGLTIAGEVTAPSIKLTKTQRIAIQACFEIVNNTQKQLNELNNQFALAQEQLKLVLEEIGISDYDINATYQLTPEDEFIRVS